MQLNVTHQLYLHSKNPHIDTSVCGMYSLLKQLSIQQHAVCALFWTNAARLQGANCCAASQALARLQCDQQEKQDH
jgi:hypothetical protein